MYVQRVGLGETHVAYEDAWALQREVHADVIAGDRPDTLLLLEHQSVYTAGRRTSRHERPTDGQQVIDVDRGGRLTWHGPGQLVVYPIVRLRTPVDVVAYVRALERAVIAVAAEWDVAAVQVPGRSGVWVHGDPRSPARKLAAIGVRVAQGVTMHGTAINVCPDLSQFDAIVPCGIEDAGVTSLSVETGTALTPLDVAATTTRHILTELSALTATAPPPPADAPAPTARRTTNAPAQLTTDGVRT
ncbi:lipoyl(octanoyl) transferase LipB [Georgenia sunbinii]|uniref:lipoyl(octanoyl) transferase LipB n=1 Tax=Georgenia sunbinii TaxID=3117728 RepID=UPI002F26BB3A